MMRCDQQQKCYLYFFEELKAAERKSFKKHLRECEYCQLEMERLKSVWSKLEDIPRERPSFQVADTIKQKAYQTKVNRNVFKLLSGWFSFSWFEYKKPLTIAAAVSIIVLLVLLSPLKEMMYSDFKDSISSEWDDNFITQVNQIDYTLDRIESYDLSSDLESLNREDTMFEDQDWSSPLLKELNTIRKSIKYINNI